MLALRAAVVLSLMTVPALAQTAAADSTDRPSKLAASPAPAPRVPPLVAGLGGSLLVPSGSFGREVGGRHGGGRAFVGAQITPRLAAGLDLASYTVDAVEETARLGSGAAVSIETTTDVQRIGAFARYGPRLGPVHVYTEALAAVSVVRTASRLADAAAEDRAETQREGIAPGLGIGVGAEVDLGDLPIAAHLRVSTFRGGAARYLAFDDATGAFTERASGTSAASVSLGLTYNVFRATQ